MALYALWEERAAPNLQFVPPKSDHPEQQLLQPQALSWFFNMCETIYWIWQLDVMQTRLEHFNQVDFVSIYDIDALGGFPFEDFLAKMFRTLGYDVQETKRTGDQGADLFVTRFGRKTVIQAKNYSGNVGNDAVQEVLAAKAFYGADQAMVVANRYFTPSAKELASGTGVQLVDRDQLQLYLDQYNRVLSGADSISGSAG
ncbi:MAG TPA: restriction endonuclease [Symbiobacteriaceae bacterium]|nr:restriction endonuclease [Symbiobacteriaceae bacterium]